MLVISRFRVAHGQAEEFRVRLEDALSALAAQEGYLEGSLGRNVDDGELWVLQTSWVGAGAYRRALSAYDVKVRAWTLLAQALDEPSAYEVVGRGQPLNDPQPRENP